jgi:Mg2+ and Co2+ transporter CorA
MSKIENFSVEFITETIMGECESIISEVENVYHSVTDDDMLNVLHFNDIRYVAENLQTLVLDYSEETDEYQTKCLLDEMSEESINLYQNIKYILEHCEIEIFSSTDTEILQSFQFMRDSINTIRSLFV